MDFCVLRRLIWCTNAGEIWDLTRSRLLIESLGITLFSYLDRDIDKDFDEGDRGVGTAWSSFGVELTRDLTICDIRGDEGCNGDGGGVCEEFCYLSRMLAIFFLYKCSLSIYFLIGRNLRIVRTYMSNSSDVLIAILL